MFNQAHDFIATGTLVENNVTLNNITSNLFMEMLFKETIPGAAFDSSARDPPPRCHPGTRLAVLERCLAFIGKCEGKKKMRWVLGAAGVGKSAIMQSVAESSNLPVTSHASVFFSINGRDDGTKAIKTICYQLAAKSGLYRQLIEQEIVRDPSLLQSSMAVQFKKLIIEPFINNSQLNSSGRVLVVIDGLDECNKPRMQQELLRIISDFCTTYPSSPLVWLIASRPEPHITSFFSKAKVLPAYEKEEIMVDSDGAREDVERFLRHELKEIKETSESLDPHSQWPEERDLWKIANAAGGLFAYADTAIKYIGDLAIGDPASQLSDVLQVIDDHPLTNVPQEQHPLALLDALYARILSNVPSKALINTRKLLLALTPKGGAIVNHDKRRFIVLCNWLALTADEAYAAVNHLRSVLSVPRRDEAHKKELTPFHKSFIDYISDFDRSGFSHDVIQEAQQLANDSAFRILKEAPDGADFGEINYSFFADYNRLKRSFGAGDNISLTWPVGEGVRWSDDETKLSVYKLAIAEVIIGMERGEPMFQTQSCIRLLTTQFECYSPETFPHDMLCDLVLDESRRDEYLMQGILKQIPIKAVSISKIISQARVTLRFRRPATTGTTFSGPWDSSCKHERKGEWSQGKDEEWTTAFNFGSCVSCFKRLQQQQANWKAQCPDHLMTILFSSGQECPVEIKVIDIADGMSEWTYKFLCRFSEAERKMYGSTV